MITVFFIGLLIVNSLLLLWFFSPIKTTLSEIFLGKSLLPMEFDDYIYSKNKILAKLNTCWICCSFWFSFIIGSVIMIVFNLSILWPMVCFFCYPSLSYIFYKIFKS